MSSLKRAPRGARIVGYAIAIAINVVLLYVFHNLQRWDLPYIMADEFSRVLPALDVSLAASTAANALFIAFDPRWFRSAAQAVLNVLSLNAVYAVWRVFPFDLPGNLGVWARRGLVALMLVIAIATVVEALKVFAPGRPGRD